MTLFELLKISSKLEMIQIRTIVKKQEIYHQIDKRIVALNLSDVKYLKNLSCLPQTQSYFITAKPINMYDTIDTKLLRNFQIIKKIGQGAYGQVWKAKNKKTGGICALKKIFDAFRNASDAQKTYREIKYLQKLEHPSIIKLLSYHKASNQREIYLQLQFMQADLCVALRNSVLKQIHKHYIFYQLTNALQYLHSAQLIHRDIKPSNILINETCEVKLCDFGLIRSLKKDSPNQQIIMTENVATRWYRAPQILLCTNNYGKAVDIWSLGCVLAEMIIQKPLFQGASTISQLQKIFQVTGKPTEADLLGMKYQGAMKVVKRIDVKQRKTLKALLNTQDYNLLDLLQKIFQINPLKRPTAEEVLVHPFINRFKGRVQQKISTNPLKVLYQSRLLSVDDYKNLLYSQNQEKQVNVQNKNKSSQDSTLDESNKIYKTMPSQVYRNNFIHNLPWANIDKTSPMHASNLNQQKLSPFAMIQKKEITPIKQVIKQEIQKKKSQSPSFLQNRKKQPVSPKVTPEKIENVNIKPIGIKKMLSFPLKFSPNKRSSPSKLVQDKSKEKISTLQEKMQKQNPELNKDQFMEFNRLNSTLVKQKTMYVLGNYLPMDNLKNSMNNMLIPQRQGKVHFQNEKNEKGRMITQVQEGKYVFNLTPSKLAQLNLDMKRNVTPNRSISPFSNKNGYTPHGTISNKNLVFKAAPVRSKLGQQTIKRHFPLAPGQIKK